MNFHQTFTAIVKPVAFRVFFTISAYYNFNINKIDIKTDFSYIHIDHLLFVKRPKKIEKNAT